MGRDENVTVFKDTERLCKDYCYSDTVMTKADFEEFKQFVNQF